MTVLVMQRSQYWYPAAVKIIAIFSKYGTELKLQKTIFGKLSIFIRMAKSQHIPRPDS